MFRRSCCAILLCLSALSTLPLAFGKSSKLVMSWKKPGYLPVEKLYRVLTLGLSDKTSVPADFEDALASQLAVTGLECIPGNTILLRPEETQFDLQYLNT